MLNRTHRSMRVSKTEKAGITFPVGRIYRLLRKGNYSNRIGVGAAVYLAVVLEYLVAEILELAGNEVRTKKKIRVIPRHLMLAIKKDANLHQLLKNVIISNSGVPPMIHPEIIRKVEKKGNIEEMKSQ